MKSLNVGVYDDSSLIFNNIIYWDYIDTKSVNLFRDKEKNGEHVGGCQANFY